MSNLDSLVKLTSQLAVQYQVVTPESIYTSNILQTKKAIFRNECVCVCTYINIYSRNNRNRKHEAFGREHKEGYVTIF